MLAILPICVPQNNMGICEKLLRLTVLKDIKRKGLPPLYRGDGHWLVIQIT